MMPTVIGSLARIADFDRNSYDLASLDMSAWASGDYVLGEVTGAPSELYNVEDCVGDMIPVDIGDYVIGALGNRAATLEGVGSWADVRDGKMQALTSAALFGAFTSLSQLVSDPISFIYRGHIVRAGTKVRMLDFALQTDATKFAVPTILLFGTSMSAGKTTTGRLACELLSAAGLKVVGSKLTGAGRYRDILSFKRHGAAEIFDFIDVGLPSTVVAEKEFRAAIRPLLHHIDSREPDFLVAEAGASPLEPYNGAAAIGELGDNICCRVLCASDPYAAFGVEKAFGLVPDLVAGPATNTTAGIDLVLKLTGVPGLNVIDPASVPKFRKFLEAQLGVHLG